MIWFRIPACRPACAAAPRHEVGSAAGGGGGRQKQILKRIRRRRGRGFEAAGCRGHLSMMHCTEKLSRGQQSSTAMHDSVLWLLGGDRTRTVPLGETL